jgi:hypothetical protein
MRLVPSSSILASEIAIYSFFLPAIDMWFVCDAVRVNHGHSRTSREERENNITEIVLRACVGGHGEQRTASLRFAASVFRSF